MSDNRLCPGGGMLGGAKHLLPDDPADKAGPFSFWIRICCNSLVCGRCGTPVRSKDRMSVAEAITQELREKLCHTYEWAELPFVHFDEDSRYRLYTCLCTTHRTRQYGPIEDDDPDPWDVQLPWHCGGHPEPTLPLVVDGTTIDQDTDIQAMVRSALLDAQLPPSVTVETSAVGSEFEWPHRLYGRLQGLPKADEVGDGLAALLATNKPGLLGAILHFYLCFPEAAGFDTLLTYLEENPKVAGREQSIKPTPANWSIWPIMVLRARLTHAASPAEELDKRCLQVMRRLLQGSPSRLSRDDWRNIARLDGEWLARNLAKVTSHVPEMTNDLLWALGTDGHGELITVGGVAIIKGGNHRAIALVDEWARSDAADTYHKAEAQVLRAAVENASPPQ